MKRALALTLFMLFILLPVTVYGHRPDRSLMYLRIYENEGIEGRFEINVNELNNYLGLDLDLHPSTEEVRVYEDKIRAYILDHAAFSSEYGNHNIIFTGEISHLSLAYGAFIRFHFKLDNVEKVPDELQITYSVFLEENNNQTNGLGIEYNWKAGLINNESIMALDFTKGNSTKILKLTDKGLWSGFMAMVRQGVWHIWIGIDHILFLLALILPSVVRRKDEEVVGAEDNTKRSWFKIWWEPVPKFKPAFWYILKVVTFFTIAHTITLSLAALNIVNLPSRWVESIIALSIGLAAYHNIRPIFRGREWVIAFAFGLFHGFGFASVMADLGFKGEFLTLSLLGFNIGVELGQVVIILLIFPILYFIRKSQAYPKILVYLSIFLIVVSLYWFVERVFEIDMPVDEYIQHIGGNILRFFGLLPPIPEY
ncbi:HupE/UreJ family protein [Pareuzebyella sediminis]|uniref:HupE/UreJ family protein n=1 Tax=Pareuzebyella sediminis TaxID=2607998 RepID=UPI0011ED8B1C|nr:HupE/UreJ family protein [Pareuzebyella sediminis]